jgi:hypothetical protein
VKRSDSDFRFILEPNHLRLPVNFRFGRFIGHPSSLNLPRVPVKNPFPLLWKSVNYWWQRLHQQDGASAQRAGTYDEQGQDAPPKHLVAGDVI